MEGVFLKSKGEKRPLTPLKARCLELSLELGALVVLKKLVPAVFKVKPIN